MSFDKYKSFEEKKDNYKIELEFLETNEEINCYVSFDFKKKSFNEVRSLINFYNVFKKYKIKYFPESTLNIQQNKDSLKIDLFFEKEVANEDLNYVPDELYKLNVLLGKINPILKKTSTNTLDNLINEFICEKIQLMWDKDEQDEIEYSIYKNDSDRMDGNLKLIEEDNIEENLYHEAILNWASIRSGQKAFMEYMSNSEFDKITDEHKKYLSKTVRTLVNTWIGKYDNFSEEEKEKYRPKLLTLINKNLDELIESQDELEIELYLDKK